MLQNVCLTLSIKQGPQRGQISQDLKKAINEVEISSAVGFPLSNQQFGFLEHSTQAHSLGGRMSGVFKQNCCVALRNKYLHIVVNLYEVITLCLQAEPDNSAEAKALLAAAMTGEGLS